MATYMIDDHFFDAPGPRADLNMARQVLIVNLLQRVCGFQDHTPKMFLQQMMRLVSNGIISIDVVPAHLRKLLETMPPYIALDANACGPTRSSVASCQARACTLPIEDPQLEFQEVNRVADSSMLVPLNETPSEVKLPFPIHVENLSIFRRDFKIERHLGQGAFGNVFHVKNNLDQQDYAVKAIQFSRGIQGRLFEQRVYRELTTWSKLNHPHIARYLHGWIEPAWGMDDTFGLGETVSPNTQHTTNYRTQSIDSVSDSSSSSGSDIVFEDSHGNHPRDTAIVPQEAEEPEVLNQPRSLISKFNYGMTLYIQMELCRDVTLENWMRSTQDPELRGQYGAIIFWQLCHALDHMHRVHGVIHRDIKPSNVFFGRSEENQLSVRLGDFGLAKRIDEFDDGDDNDLAHSHNVGTFAYSSPEQMANRSYSYATDIYSLGLLLVEMFTPCTTSMERAVMLQNLRQLELPTSLASFPQLSGLALAMLSPDPADRPSAAEILGSSGWAPSILREFHEAYDFTDTALSFTYFNPPTPGSRPQPITYQSPINAPNSTLSMIPELCLPPARDSHESLTVEVGCQTQENHQITCPHCGQEIKEARIGDRTPSETGSEVNHGTTSTLSDSDDYGCDDLIINKLQLDEALQSIE